MQSSHNALNRDKILMKVFIRSVAWKGEKDGMTQSIEKKDRLAPTSWNREALGLPHAGRWLRLNRIARQVEQYCTSCRRPPRSVVCSEALEPNRVTKHHCLHCRGLFRCEGSSFKCAVVGIKDITSKNFYQTR